MEKLNSQVAELEKRLAEVQAQKERAISRAQMTKSGHVYVISYVGSFGKNVYKIGMTRRLEPLDRVKELLELKVPKFIEPLKALMVKKSTIRRLPHLKLKC